MNDYLPDAVRDGLEAARKAALRNGSRMSIHDGDAVFRILKFEDDVLHIGAEHADKLRGRVDIFDGARQVYQCLIEDPEVVGDTCRFHIKWIHPVTDGPPADFERPEFRPAGLIGTA